MLLLLLAGGCASHNHKAQSAISAYVQKTTENPDSYVAISFGEPHAIGSKADTVLINHVYQVKNKAGASVIYSHVFKVDSTSGYALKVGAR
ncbi:hypothetical protein A8B98_09605 [Hymenobacter sp. UV11]|nr:hypothetical protein A8B98_09605 [Hymenobacter sp. UV11]